MMVGHGITGIVVDAILLFLPIWVICTKIMWTKKTLQIVLVLSVGIFAVATGIIRVVLIKTKTFVPDVYVTYDPHPLNTEFLYLTSSLIITFPNANTIGFTEHTKCHLLASGRILRVMSVYGAAVSPLCNPSFVRYRASFAEQPTVAVNQTRWRDLMSLK